ncbi:MAG: H-NS family nucleoid-associated regulatory protein [Betaproteobacteria bacterium]
MGKIKELQQEKLDAKTELEEALNEEKVAAIKTIREQIKRLGISQNDLFGKNLKATLEAKYELNSLVWSGKGTAPDEYKKYVANGGRMDDLLLKD